MAVTILAISVNMYQAETVVAQKHAANFDFYLNLFDVMCSRQPLALTKK